MKTGLFGGTFSPPHNGHVRAAKLFCDRIGLDRLIVMPDSAPPHKNADRWGTPEKRLEMARLAFGDFSTVSDFEVKKGGKSYTVDTVRFLKKEYPGDELFLLVGEDMFLSFESWRLPEEIFRMTALVCLRRTIGKDKMISDAASLYRQKYGACIYCIDDMPLEMSSSEIRGLCARGADISPYVPRKVAEYINEKGLYRL